MNIKKMYQVLKEKWYIPLIIGLIISSSSSYAFVEENKYQDHDYITEDDVDYINFQKEVPVELSSNSKDFMFLEQSLLWIGYKNSTYWLVHFQLQNDMRGIDEISIIDLTISTRDVDVDGIYVSNNQIWMIQNKLYQNHTLQSFILGFNFDGTISSNYSLPTIETGPFEKVGAKRTVVGYANTYLIYSETNSSFHINRIGRYSLISGEIEYIEAEGKLGRDLFYSNNLYWTWIRSPYWSLEGEDMFNDWYGFSIDFEAQSVQLQHFIENKISNNRGGDLITSSRYNIFVEYGLITADTMIIPVQSSIPKDNNSLTGLNIYTIHDANDKKFAIAGIVFGLMIVILGVKKRYLDRE